jgi:dienelactone hydrolase
LRTLLLYLAALSLPQATIAQSNFTQANHPGPHPVGVRVVEQYDFSRGYRGSFDANTGKPLIGERARPIQTVIWYPTGSDTGPSMTAGDYLKLGGTTDNFDAAPLLRSRLESDYVGLQTADLTKTRAQTELAAPMAAHLDAPPLSGKYPVVIYAPSFGAPASENADLCEYLASFGYVVIASPSIGQTPDGMTTDLEGAEAQMSDIEFLIGYAHTLPEADNDHLAVMGYSWGGLANVMAAAKDRRIDAIVALDGSVRYWPGIVEQAHFVSPERVTAPLLYIAAAPKELEILPAGMNRDTSFLNKMEYADVYRVTIAPYVHGNFSVLLGQRFLADDGYVEYSKDELSSANGWVETYVLRFLDAQLKNDAAARSFLDMSAPQVGAPPHLFTLYKRKATGPPPTRETFAAELNRQGFAKASGIYHQMQKQTPSFVLSDDDLNAWGFTLLGNGDVPASLAILRLNTELHPESWNAWDSLGEVYAKNGDRSLAIEAYRKSLSLNPGNSNAVQRLAVLGAKL